MKKLLIILILGLMLTSCSREEEVKIPFNVTKAFTENRFDTVLVVKGESNTYYFNKSNKNFIHKIANNEIKSTETNLSVIGYVIFFIFAILIILSILL